MIEVRYNNQNKIEMFDEKGTTLTLYVDSIDEFKEKIKSSEFIKVVMKIFNLNEEQKTLCFIGYGMNISNIKL